MCGVGVDVGDLRMVPLRDARVDGLWFSASLLHVPSDEAPATLRSWAGCLRPGGTLGLSTSLDNGAGWEESPYDSDEQPEVDSAPTLVRPP